MRSRWFGVCLYFFAMVGLPLSAWVGHPAAAVAQVRREPTSQLGQSIGNKTDEVVAIAIKVAAGLLVFYAVFIIVKFASGNGQEGWRHTLYWVLAAALLAGIDQVVSF